MKIEIWKLVTASNKSIKKLLIIENLICTAITKLLIRYEDAIIMQNELDFSIKQLYGLEFYIKFKKKSNSIKRIKFKK